MENTEIHENAVMQQLKNHLFHKHKLQNLHSYHTKHAIHTNCGKQA